MVGVCLAYLTPFASLFNPYLPYINPCRSTQVVGVCLASAWGLVGQDDWRGRRAALLTARYALSSPYLTPI